MASADPSLSLCRVFFSLHQIENVFKGFGFLVLNLIPQCYEILVLARTWLLSLHRGCGMAASPLDNAIDVALYFIKEMCNYVFWSAALM